MVDQVNWISKRVVIKQLQLNKARTATVITVMTLQDYLHSKIQH